MDMVDPVRDAEADTWHAMATDHQRRVDGNHGRIDVRASWLITAPEVRVERGPQGSWRGRSAIGMGQPARSSTGTPAYERRSDIARGR